MTNAAVPVRVSAPSDVDAIVSTMTSAFFDDPLWGPAFPDRALRAAQAGALWRLFVRSGQRYPWVMVTGQVESAALWIPPGGSDLSDGEASGFEEYLVANCGRVVADGLLAILEVLEAHHPSEPHYYLSLLATHSDHRGAGLGMGLLRENLARIDALGGSAYLESCNPVNNARYRSVGFVEHAELTVPSGHVVTTMWRAAHSGLGRK
jgi:GNAT superfamily N-acetyltransferase